jgi:hypothetical protein
LTAIWYETETDRQNEREIVRQFLELRGIDMSTGRSVEKLPVDYGFDFALLSAGNTRRLQAVIEVKERARLYDTVMLSLSKFRQGTQFAREGIPALFVIRSPQGLYWYKFSGEDKPPRVEIAFGGRAGRDKQEPIALIPLNLFRKET